MNRELERVIESCANLMIGRMLMPVSPDRGKWFDLRPAATVGRTDCKWWTEVGVLKKWRSYLAEIVYTQHSVAMPATNTGTFYPGT